MLLMAFIVFQIVLDAVLVTLALVALRRGRAALASAREPAAAQTEFLLLAEDLLGVLEPVLTAIESGRLTPAAAPAASPVTEGAGATPPEDRHRRAFELLRAGVSQQEVGQRERLLPGEVRLMTNLVAAETRAAALARAR